MLASCDLAENKNLQNDNFQFYPLFKFIATFGLFAIAALFKVLIRYVSKFDERKLATRTERFHFMKQHTLCLFFWGKIFFFKYSLRVCEYPSLPVTWIVPKWFKSERAELSQKIFNCSKSTIKTLEKGILLKSPTTDPPTHRLTIIKEVKIEVHILNLFCTFYFLKTFTFIDFLILLSNYYWVKK